MRVSVQHEPTRQLPRQRSDGELLPAAQVMAHKDEDTQKKQDEARSDAFDYIEMFDNPNPKLRHSSNGNLSPIVRKAVRNKRLTTLYRNLSDSLC